MIIRNVDINHDWTFGSGTNNYLAGDDAIGLNIETRVLSWLNDCFFSLLSGVDWLTRLGSKGEEALLDADIRRIILQSYGVTGLTQLNVSVEDRNFRVEYTIVTIYSPSYQAIITGGV